MVAYTFPIARSIVKLLNVLKSPPSQKHVSLKNAPKEICPSQVHPDLSNRWSDIGRSNKHQNALIRYHMGVLCIDQLESYYNVDSVKN